MGWLSFLQKTVSASVAAAAGGAAGVVSANPMVGAAAGAAAKTSTEELIGELLGGQQEALGTLIERTRNLEVMLGSVQSDVRAMLNGPWETALLHIADAAKRPDRAQAELRIARDLLYQAWGQTNRGAKRALIAQELSAVYLLLGELEDSRDWLFASYPQAEFGVGDVIGGVVESLRGLRAVRFGATLRRASGGYPIDVPERLLAVQRGPDDVIYCVRREPLLTALTSAAQARLDLAGLRLACALAGMPGKWEQSSGWSIKAEAGSQPPHVEMFSGKGMGIVWGPRAAPMPAAELLLGSIVRWEFTLTDIPPSFLPANSVTSPGAAGEMQFFVIGDCPELGRWSIEQALPLRTQWGRHGVYDFRGSVEAVGDAGAEVEYKYLAMPPEGGEPSWEEGPNRVLPPPARDRYGGQSRRRLVTDSWRSH